MNIKEKIFYNFEKELEKKCKYWDEGGTSINLLINEDERKEFLEYDNEDFKGLYWEIEKVEDNIYDLYLSN